MNIEAVTDALLREFKTETGVTPHLSMNATAPNGNTTWIVTLSGGGVQGKHTGKGASLELALREVLRQIREEADRKAERAKVAAERIVRVTEAGE